MRVAKESNEDLSKGGQNSNLRAKTLINLHEAYLNFKEHLAFYKKKVSLATMIHLNMVLA